MIERITKNKKTTTLGIMIILGSMILVGFEKATLTEAAAFIVAGIGCLFAKDKAVK
jgi:hypothetical protein